MVLNDDASAPISSRARTSTRDERSPPATRPAAAATARTGRVTRRVAHHAAAPATASTASASAAMRHRPEPRRLNGDVSAGPRYSSTGSATPAPARVARGSAGGSAELSASGSSAMVAGP